MSRTRFECAGLITIKLNFFIPIPKDASTITKEDLVKILANPDYFMHIANSIKSLQTLVQRFKEHGKEIFFCVMNPEYFNLRMTEVNDLYTLVELFPQQSNEIYLMAKKKGFGSYISNSADIWSETPVELILLAFPDHRDDIIEDWNSFLDTPRINGK